MMAKTRDAKPGESPRNRDIESAIVEIEKAISKIRG